MKSKFKIIVTSLIIITVAYSVVPKTYFHSIFFYKHNVLAYFKTNCKAIENKGNKDFNFEKHTTPVYYSVFKFILNFLPISPNREISCSFNQNQSFKTNNSFSFLKIKLII